MMSAYPAASPDSRDSHDRLGFAACLALALHAAIILGISFNVEDRSRAAPKLEITLAQYRSEQAPEQADFLAQHSQKGSGTLTEKAMITTTRLAEFQDTQIHEVAPLQQQRAQQAISQTERTLITTTGNSRQHSSQRNPLSEQQPTPTDDPSEVELQQRLREIASLEARLDTMEQAYAKRPRIRRLTSLATQQSIDARYLHQWRRKIEAIGNQNYPEAARQQNIFGQLRMLVSLMPNGEVREVKVLSSSGHKVLDEAAVRIVHLSAPYPPFPNEMQREVDVLEIIRTWKFHKNRLISES